MYDLIMNMQDTVRIPSVREEDLLNKRPMVPGEKNLMLWVFC